MEKHYTKVSLYLKQEKHAELLIPAKMTVAK
jgi:hypothetical protein